MDSHEYHTIRTLRAAWEEGRSDGKEHVRQQAEVGAELKTMREEQKRGRR